MYSLEEVHITLYSYQKLEIHIFVVWFYSYWG